MKLSNLFESELAPTARFIPFHGNYCGPGNRGGDPIDCLDGACYRHDIEYDRSYKETKAQAKERRRSADIEFVKNCMMIAQDKSLDRKLRVKACVAVKLFVTKHKLTGNPIAVAQSELVPASAAR